MWVFKFSYWLLEILTKQIIKNFLQSEGFNFVNRVSPAKNVKTFL